MKGLIFDGAQSPSAGVNDNAGGFDSILYDHGDFVGGDGKERESEGWYVDVGYDIHQHLGLKNRTTLNLRYDEFDRNKGKSQGTRSQLGDLDPAPVSISSTRRRELPQPTSGVISVLITERRR